MYATVSLAEGKELDGELLATGKEEQGLLFWPFIHCSLSLPMLLSPVLPRGHPAWKSLESERRCQDYRTMKRKGRREILRNGWWPRWESLSHWSFLDHHSNIRHILRLSILWWYILQPGVIQRWQSSALLFKDLTIQINLLINCLKNISHSHLLRFVWGELNVDFSGNISKLYFVR